MAALVPTRMYPAGGCHSFYSPPTSCTHVTLPINAFGNFCRFVQHQPHPGVSVLCCRTLEEIELFIIFVCVCVFRWAFLQVDSWMHQAPAPGHSAVTKGFQLGGIGPHWGAPGAPAHRGATVRTLCVPAVTAPCYTHVGNFKQTSSKAGGRRGKVYREEHSWGLSTSPLALYSGATMLHVPLWLCEQGASCTTGALFVCVCLDLSYLFRGAHGPRRGTA